MDIEIIELVDMTEKAKEYGFKRPFVSTTEVFDRIFFPAEPGRSVEARLNEVLLASARASKAFQKGQASVRFQCDIAPYIDLTGSATPEVLDLMLVARIDETGVPGLLLASAGAG